MTPEEIPLPQPKIPEDFATREFIEASEGKELTQQAIELMGEVRALAAQIENNVDSFTDGFVEKERETMASLETEFSTYDLITLDSPGGKLEDLYDSVSRGIIGIDEEEQEKNAEAKEKILAATSRLDAVKKWLREKLKLINSTLPDEIKNVIQGKLGDYLNKLDIKTTTIEQELNSADSLIDYAEIIKIVNKANRDMDEINSDIEEISKNLSTLINTLSDIYSKKEIANGSSVQEVKSEIIGQLGRLDIHDIASVTAFDDFEKDIVIAEMADRLGVDSEKLFSIISAIAQNKELSGDDQKIAEAYKTMIDKDTQFKLFAEEVTPKIPEAKRILAFTADGTIDESVPNDPKIKEAVRKTIKLKSYALGGWKDVNKKLAENMGIKDYDEAAFMKRVEQLQRDANMPEDQIDGKIGPITSQYLAKAFGKEVTIPLGEVTAWQDEETPGAPATRAA